MSFLARYNNTVLIKIKITQHINDIFKKIDYFIIKILLK